MFLCYLLSHSSSGFISCFVHSSEEVVGSFVRGVDGVHCKYVDVPMTLNPESHTQYTIELSFISAQGRLYLDGQASIYYLRLLGQKKQ